jgi:acyl dehydratase
MRAMRATEGGRAMSERDPVTETGTVASILHPDRDAGRSTTALYLDDLRVGQRFTSGSLRVEEAEIKASAAQFDPQPFRLDESAARASMFGGLAASGWHTAALSMRLLVDGGAPIAGAVIGASGELAWPRPTRPGDVLTVETEVLEVVPSKSRPDRGFATLRSETRNQDGEPVQILTMKLLVPRRPARTATSGPEETV